MKYRDGVIHVKINFIVRVAQLVEQRTHKPLVAGPSPAPDTKS